MYIYTTRMYHLFIYFISTLYFRACIGERFAMVEMKIAMAKLLQNFRIEATDETK